MATPIFFCHPFFHLIVELMIKPGSDKQRRNYVKNPFPGSAQDEWLKAILDRPARYGQTIRQRAEADKRQGQTAFKP
jgi:hypothetical protein